MPPDIAIQARGLGKCYHIYGRPQDRLWQSLWPGRKQLYREFWALREVDLDIRRGETVGIVGRNGSGKSTLLQLIAGTLAPTSGSVEVSGRLAALLELGSGFNPDFSGRENVYMNGAILGLDRAEIDRRFDSIAAFADIGEFIEQPVRAYSSGMIVRLAFAVSVCVEPDILIVDEALAVGDELFQRKCYARVRALQDNGAAILFVSHATAAVIELCGRAVLLDAGRKLLDDRPKPVITAYHRLLYGSTAAPGAVAQSEPERASAQQTGSGADYDAGLTPSSTVAYASLGAVIVDPHFETPDGRRVNVLARGEEYQFAYRVAFDREARDVHFGMLIKNKFGAELAGATTAHSGDEIAQVRPGQEARVRFRFRCLFLPDLYFANAGCGANVEGEAVFLHRILDATVFRVQPEGVLTLRGIVDLGMVPDIALADGAIAPREAAE